MEFQLYDVADCLVTVLGELRTSDVTSGVRREQSMADGAKKLFMVFEVMLLHASRIGLYLQIHAVVEYCSAL